MRVNLKGLGLYGENLSWSDSVKIAQYEVLGMKQKDTSVPSGTIENARLLVLHAAQRLPAFVDRPVRGRMLFENANPALRTGLISSDPAGLILFNHQRTCAILIASP